MKIQYLKIENYKSIKNFELDNFSHINVLTGINGSGKTAILSAIRILLSWLIARIHNPKGSGLKILDSDISRGEDYCYLMIKLDNGVEWSIYKQYSKVRKVPVYKTDMTMMSALANEIANSIYHAPESADLTLIAAYGVTRTVSETPVRVRKKHKLMPLDALSIGMGNSVNFHDFFVWFREMEDIENEGLRNTGKLKKDRRLEAVRCVINSLIDGYTDFKVQRSPKSFIISKNKIKFDFKQLSDGEKAYLTLISDIARKLAMCHPTLDNPLMGDGIILIDEIDLHLHPTWQREMIGRLRKSFCNCQFIITTHSPHVVSSVSPVDGEKLIVINNGKAYEAVDNLYGQKVDIILSDVFHMDSLRAPLVQDHLNKVWECLRQGDYKSEKFKTHKNWLEEHVDSDDFLFSQINLQIKLIEKGLA